MLTSNQATRNNHSPVRVSIGYLIEAAPCRQEHLGDDIVDHLVRDTPLAVVVNRRVVTAIDLREAALHVRIHRRDRHQRVLHVRYVPGHGNRLHDVGHGVLHQSGSSGQVVSLMP